MGGEFYWLREIGHRLARFRKLLQPADDPAPRIVDRRQVRGRQLLRPAVVVEGDLMAAVLRRLDVPCDPGSLPLLSQNLRVLKEAGLVKERRLGTSRLYRADRAALRPLESYLRRMWARNIDRLRLLAEAEERSKSKR